MIEYTKWMEETKWEADWWGNCANTLREELLQFAYAERMGIKTTMTDRSLYNIDCNGGSILDIGGGPVSMLLKCFNFSRAVVVDPCEFPDWVDARYKAAGIAYVPVPAERFLMFPESLLPFTEVWIYNVLQHTMDPKLIIENAFAVSDTVRIFEYIEAGVSPGHPHELHSAELCAWLLPLAPNSSWSVDKFDEHSAHGKVFYGVFRK